MEANQSQAHLQEHLRIIRRGVVDMIENQRSYEVQANLLKEAKSMDEASASLMRLPG